MLAPTRLALLARTTSRHTLVQTRYHVLDPLVESGALLPRLAGFLRDLFGVRCQSIEDTKVPELCQSDILTARDLRRSFRESAMIGSIFLGLQAKLVTRTVQPLCHTASCAYNLPRAAASRLHCRRAQTGLPSPKQARLLPSLLA